MINIHNIEEKYECIVEVVRNTRDNEENRDSNFNVLAGANVLRDLNGFLDSIG